MSKRQSRPDFLAALGRAYQLRRKNIVMLTGDIHGLFWNQQRDAFSAFESTLVDSLKEKFNIIRMDIATGISFPDKPTEMEVMRICESKDGVVIPKDRRDQMTRLIDSSRHSPLPALVLIRGIQEAFVRVRKEEPDIKPLCVLFQYAGALFPTGDFGRLGDLDRQRLVVFLSWVNDPRFTMSPDLLILANDVKSEINHKINALPHCTHIEIPLPAQDDRESFVNWFNREGDRIRFKDGKGRFVENTAGLKLTHLKDMLEEARRSKTPITKEQVVDQVNEILQAELGDIIRVKYPSHTSKDIIGYKEAGGIFKSIFERCEDRETAVSAILVSGPNGAGKTFQLEAYAAESGRVVIELAGIRGSYFGETDRFFELLRWHISTFGKILILVDEAHTAFGSVHSGDTHQTEMRLSGNIIKMMGNPDYLSKVLWGMMTSRPDELDPDIKSRAPIQVPIFDLEGEPRERFVKEMFKRKGIKLGSEIEEILKATDYYSARDYRNLVAEVLAQQKKNPEVTAQEVLSGWYASKSIKTQREFQSLIAALHCSYPNLLPEGLRSMTDVAINKQIETLKFYLSR
ncbi:MAG: AAA family ATPase [Acidobacteria bacterium]|nr:AAA family ATPase [Acidobacteriota bacterium]